MKEPQTINGNDSRNVKDIDLKKGKDPKIVMGIIPNTIGWL